MNYIVNDEVTTMIDSKGNTFLIDTNQLERVLVCNWYVGNKGYVRTASRKYNRMFLHRFLLGTSEQVDHINRIKTDNRLCNLRTCTSQENNRNRVYKNTQSGVQGVCVIKKNGKTRYRARVCVDGKRISLGYFDSLEEAERVYKEKTRELYFSYSPWFVKK